MCILSTYQYQYILGMYYVPYKCIQVHTRQSRHCLTFLGLFTETFHWDFSLATVKSPSEVHISIYRYICSTYMCILSTTQYVPCYSTRQHFFIHTSTYLLVQLVMFLRISCFRRNRQFGFVHRTGFSLQVYTALVRVHDNCSG